MQVCHRNGETTGGIDYAQKKMIDYRDEALAILNEFRNVTFAKAWKNWSVLQQTENIKRSIAYRKFYDAKKMEYIAGG